MRLGKTAAISMHKGQLVPKRRVNRNSVTTGDGESDIASTGPAAGESCTRFRVSLLWGENITDARARQKACSIPRGSRPSPVQGDNTIEHPLLGKLSQIPGVFESHPQGHQSRLTALLGESLRGALIALGLMAAGRVGAEDYNVLISGRSAGSMTVTQQAGRQVTEFTYSDRGMGPKITSSAVLDRGGFPREFNAKGLNSNGAHLEDHCWTKGRAAQWKTNVDSGASRRRAFYIPLEQSPADVAQLARALLKSPTREARLRPTGKATIRQVRSIQTAQFRATLYLIDGIDWAPVPIWLDAHNNLVMYNFNKGWLTTIRRGFENAEKQLLDAQTDALVASERAIARRLISGSPSPLVIQHAALFDAEQKRVVHDVAVVVDKKRITAVGPTSSTPIPAGANVIDASGKTLVPGLWDMHTHFYSDYFGRLVLANGITSVRDLGGTRIDRILARRDAYASGDMIGPKIVTSGFMDGPGPITGPTDAVVSIPEQVRSWVDRYAAAGVSYIKLYSSVDPKLVPVAVGAARAHGLRVGGHVPNGLLVEDVVRAGFNEVQHASYWLDNLIPPEIPRPTTDAEAEAFDAATARIDARSPRAQEFIRLLVSHNTVVDPTISVEEIYRKGVGQLPPDLLKSEGDLPPRIARANKAGGLATSERDAEYLKQAITLMLRLLKEMYDAGVTILPGTDTAVRGFTYVHELELYESAGIPAVDVLYLATLGSARIVGRDKELGSIAPGKLADMVLVKGDPTKTVGNLRNPALVIKDGVVLDPRLLLSPNVPLTRGQYPPRRHTRRAM